MRRLVRSKAFSNSGGRRGWGAAAAALLAFAVVPVGRLPAEDGAVGGNVVPVEKAPAEFRLERKDAERGGQVAVRVSVAAKVALEAISVAINFDEEDLRVEKIEPLLDFLVDAPPDIRSVSDLDNENRRPGNQASEGWIHAEIESERALHAINARLGSPVPLYVVWFRVRADAKAGLSRVAFEDIGPVRLEDREVYYKNSVTIARDDIGPGEAQEVEDDDLRSGGVNIIGEVGFFLRGDATYDFRRDITDPLLTLRVLFRSDDDFPCADAADANDDGNLDVSDAVFSLLRLFVIREPWPEPNVYGLDPTEDALDCEKGGVDT